MILEVSHRILAMVPDFSRSCRHVEGFLERTSLVHYDTVQVVAEESCPGSDQRFFPWLDQGIAENRLVLDTLLGELLATGSKELTDLARLPQGFESKILHTIAHLADGFFGIDSRFYSLPEDSHWLSPTLRSEIKNSPDDFWLIKVNASLIALERGPVFGLRSFEK